MKDKAVASLLCWFWMSTQQDGGKMLRSNKNAEWLDDIFGHAMQR